MAEAVSVVGGLGGMTSSLSPFSPFSPIEDRSPLGDKGGEDDGGERGVRRDSEAEAGDAAPGTHRLAGFEELVLRHQIQIYRVAYRLTGNHADAEDLAQEAIVEAFQAFDRYQPGTYFDRWLYRIMSRTYIDTVRRRNRRPVISLDAPAGGEGSPLVTLLGNSGEDPQQITEAMDLDGTIQAALDGLSHEFRTVVVLADIEGLSYDEIAAVLRCPVGTVRSRLHRARQMLRQALGPHLGVRSRDR